MYAVLQVAPALNTGGVERTTIEMAEAVVQDGGVALVASAGGRLESELETVGGELARMPLETKNPATVWANAASLERLARERSVTLIHARSRAPAWSAFLAARRLGLPFVTTYHGVYNAKNPVKRFYNSVMARGDVVIANSEFTRTHLIAEHKIDDAKVVAIPRGVDLKRFDPESVALDRVAALERAWAADDRLVILLPARLTRWKGALVLLDAARRLKLMGVPPFKIVFAGDAQGRDGFVDEVTNTAAEYGLTEYIVVAGHVEDMPAAYLLADIVVLPTTEAEAFGRTAAEASAMARPVIASAHGGYTETVLDQVSGLLVAPGLAVDLAVALRDLIERGPIGRSEMGRAGQARIRALYTKTALQASTLQVYHRLMGDRV